MYTFLKDKILDEENREVMMDWETGLMQEHAKVVTENGGDILEIGFGMGICANFIQQANINTHTIIEIHDEIFKHLLEWAKDKPNVIPIKGDWFDSIPKNKKYDGIMHDTWQEKNFHHFFAKVQTLLKSKGIVTYYNAEVKESLEFDINKFKWCDLSIKEIKVNPPKNMNCQYYYRDTYLIPKLVYNY
jgi:predicted O-methyltransferase YrrM